MGRRLIELWSVVEYVAALILKNRSAMFPENINGWSKQITHLLELEPLNFYGLARVARTAPA